RRAPPGDTLLPYTTLFRSSRRTAAHFGHPARSVLRPLPGAGLGRLCQRVSAAVHQPRLPGADRHARTARATGPDRPAHGGPGLARQLPGFRDPAPGRERHAPPPVAPAAARRRRGRTGPPLRRAMGGFPRVLSTADALRPRATPPVADRRSFGRRQATCPPGRSTN